MSKIMDKFSLSDLANVELDPTSVVSMEEWDTLFPTSESLELGTPLVPPLDDLQTFMELWTERIDEKIQHVQQYSPLYHLLFSNRGITYNEYTLLFKEIPEEKYKHYPVYEFLRVPSKDYLVELRVGLEETMESYFSLLLQTLEQTNRTGIVFFLKKLKSLIPLFELQRHCYIPGATGSGKSELIRLMIYRLWKTSNKGKTRSIVLIEPHGTLANQIKTSHLNSKGERLIYVEPDLRKGWSPVINPFEIHSKDEAVIATRAQTLANAFKETVESEFTVNMAGMLIPCISLLLRLPDTTILDLIRLMQNDKDLIALGRTTGSKAQRMFFDTFTENHYNRTKLALYTKLQTFLTFPAFYNLVIGKSTIDIGKAINSGKVLVFNLTQQQFGPEASKAFGRFIISIIKSHIKSRKQYRKPTYLFVDECQNFISPSIEDILDEARKYGLHLILANHAVERLGKVEEVVLGNTAVKLVGRNDSIQTMKKMSAITGADYKTFQRLNNFEFFVKTSRSSGQVFRASDALIKDKSRSLKPDAVRKLEKAQIKAYYRNVRDDMDEIDRVDHEPKFDL